ncbi:Cdc6/Cdc18 family protein [Halosimplex halophilum]|uniref:Cdc6/Cdc18 family protein n=1 Tax=Halosimplex halophilum TaxID=2559572 RepID=UPI001435507C|nr:Cdc6/Cdc18 family protein [Halosimplex halophilum]
MSRHRVLDEEAVPERDLVVHRRAELDRLMETVRPTGTGPADLTYLIGPTGTGKTMLSKLAFELLEDDAAMPPHDWVYLNCWSHTERTAILYEIVDDLREAPIHKNTSQSDLIRHLEEDADRPQFAILDEVDQLHDKAILYDLHAAPNLNLILIGNREDDLFAGMSDRVQSRLTVGTRIECERYSAQQLAAILHKRAEYVLGPPGAHYTERQLDTIATNAEGDARVAIRTLRVAIEHSDRGLEDAAIEESVPRAKDQLLKKSREQLPAHQLEVLEIVEGHGPIETPAIYSHYQDRVDDPRTERMVRTYCSKLEQYNHIRSEGPDNNPSWVATTSEIPTETR